jgi:hypothetical protein
LSFRFTLILLAVAIVAIAGFGIAQKASPPSNGLAATPTPILLDLQPSGVTDFDVKTGDHETELTKNGTTWQLVKPSQTSDVDQTKVSQLVSQVATLAGTRSVASGAGDLQPYGLRTPFMTVALTGANNKQEVLLIGDKTINGNAYYAMRQGGSDVALIDSALVASLSGIAATPPLATPGPTPTAVSSSLPLPSASS